jgi:hypothetical protein
MNRSTHALDGSPGAHFTIARQEDGRFKVTTTSWPELQVVADKQNDALQKATQEFRDAVLQGKIGSAR